MVSKPLKSRYKNLVVSGCSFTTDEHVPTEPPWNWASTLCADTGMTIHNLASGAAGNTHISRSIILYLELNNLDPVDTLVMAMWSGVGRIDWTVSHDAIQQRYNYNYTPQCKSLKFGNWWNIRGNNPVTPYAKLQNNHTFALESWLSMTSLSTYLDCKGYKYFYTSFVDYKNKQIKGDALTVPYDETLKEMNLAVDYSHWLPLPSTDYFGDWCRQRNLIAEDDFHPGLDGPQRWPREVLAPLLHKMDILYDV